MAFIEKRGGKFRLIFRYGGKRFRRSLLTDNERAARSSLARVEDNLRRVELGLLEIPDGADISAFLVSDGRALEQPKPKQGLALKELFDAYFAALPDGNLEPTTLATMRQHLKLLYGHFGESFQVRTLTLTHLQQYVEKRAKQKNGRGKPVTPITIKKAVVTLRTVWNWGIQHELLEKTFPGKGLKYPKAKEKPPFQPYADVEALAKRLSPEDAFELWECAFLTLPEIDELLKHVKAAARQPFIYPLFVFAAHTGARRSEIMRSRVTDIDFKSNVITIHERKKSHDSRTTRRVPMSPLLSRVMKDWIARHPGGEFTFCQDAVVPRSKTRRTAPTAITRDEAHDHFKRTLANSRWSNLRGWHSFRHAFCSNAAAAGIDQRIINAWVGHQTETMVLRYRHMIPNQSQEAIRRVFTA